MGGYRSTGVKCRVCATGPAPHDHAIATPAGLGLDIGCTATRWALAMASGQVRVVGDITLSFLDCFAPGEGCLVHAGTGSIAQCIEPDGQSTVRARVAASWTMGGRVTGLHAKHCAMGHLRLPATGRAGSGAGRATGVPVARVRHTLAADTNPPADPS
jgi:hypothetical protein